MKKRVLCLLLSFCLVAGLFAGMPAKAYADGGSTQTYTVTKDDGAGLAAVCKKLGVDFNANQEWIKNTNKLDNKFSIYPGQVLTLPAAGVVLKWTDTSASTTTTGASTAGSTTATTTAGVPTIQYTLKNGDNVITVCKNLGIDFAANDAWIRAVNGITNYNNLKVGRVLTLPAPGTTPALSTATGTAATTTAATTTAVTTGVLSGDTVQYYLVNYTVVSGDTLFNICNRYGANMDTVQKLNNITNAAALRVGQVLTIPTTATPSGTYTKVVAHKVVSGDTVQGICKSYGVDYGKTANQIKALNNRDNLDAIKVGQTILIPVPSTAVVPGGSGGTTPSGGSSGTTGGNYYTLNKLGTTNGTYALTVGGQAVNSANAGQTVHLVIAPDHGYKIKQISVVRSYNGDPITVDKNNNFVMPSCDVRIAVLFEVDDTAQPHQIVKSNVCDATVTPTYVVNGYTNTVAEKGQTVQIVVNTLPSGKLIDKVYVTTVQPTLEQLQKGTIDAKYVVGVSSNLTFTMPATIAYVTIILKNA